MLRPICLWINKYKTLEKSLITFSSRYSVTNDCVIKERESEFHVYGEFQDITAFVGKNGAGKTSVMEAVSAILCGNEDLVDGVLVVQNHGEFFSVGLGRKDFYFGGKKINRFKEIDIFRGAGVIYYSPVYNPHSFSLNPKKKFFKNISNDREYSFKREKNREIDFQKQFNFFDGMGKFAREILGFDKYLKVDLKLPDIQVLKRRILRVMLEPDFLRDQDTRQYFFRKLSEMANDDSLILDLIEDQIKERDIYKVRSALDTVFIDKAEAMHSYYHQSDFYDQSSLSLAMRFLTSNFFLKETHPYEAVADKQLTTIDMFFELMDTDNFRRWALKVLKFSKSIDNRSYRDRTIAKDCDVLHQILDSVNVKSPQFPLFYPPSKSTQALEIISNIRRSNLMKYGFEIGWQGVSSGQVAKMNLYSRIYNAIGDSQWESLLLLLDEADIYLHPEWQRTFLHELSIFFMVFKKQHPHLKLISLILTTHSPLMISDLFKEDVYLIDDSVKPYKVKSARKHTFGANIYQLYREEFVTTNPKGELASLAIKKIVRDLNEILSTDNVQYFQQLISKIGDPVIQKGLQGLVENKMDQIQ
ncbi:AAA family ATPase [Peredibacter starrii]|uniref:AAA family ATPase n=1 Tax=Peredibacter starrii TaxID=28202 RepID=A0AAX4HTA6_9BACT|nr:AAA family ATPase [Peredibacter starrii]WPU66636.1 AAA family ATPase [Peredibacter starrii]